MTNYEFKTDFPRLEAYTSATEISKKFDCLQVVNSKTFQPSQVKNVVYFMIKSTNDDDFHKAIKYGVWTSSPRNNFRFSQEFAKKKQVIFFFRFFIILL